MKLLLSILIDVHSRGRADPRHFLIVFNCLLKLLLRILIDCHSRGRADPHHFLLSLFDFWSFY